MTKHVVTINLLVKLFRKSCKVFSPIKIVVNFSFLKPQILEQIPCFSVSVRPGVSHLTLAHTQKQEHKEIL